MSKRKASADPTSALLGDLESIRALLELEDGDEDYHAPQSSQPDSDVPVLEDVVDAGADTAAANSEPEPNLNSDAGPDESSDSADDLLAQLRRTIGEHREDWTSKESHALNDTLTAIIDETLQSWTRDTIVTHIPQLHEALLTKISEELRSAIENIIEQREGTGDGE